MSNTRQVIALAGVGSLGKYICEELLANKERFDLVVLSRQKKQWFEERKLKVEITDYSAESVRSILDFTGATTLLSFISCSYNTSQYFDAHSALLEACTQSKICKRFIPSEYIGNIEDFPLLPTFYDREPFRHVLKKSNIQWTLLESGWLMDYLMTAKNTYMRLETKGYPIHLEDWEYTVLGKGDQLQTFTCARDVAKAMVQLLSAKKWDPITYVAGDWASYNEVAEKLEGLYNRPMKKLQQSWEQIEDTLAKHTGPVTFGGGAEVAMINEWTIFGASACPQDRTLEQRKKYFGNVNFRGLQDVLTEARDGKFI